MSNVRICNGPYLQSPTWTNLSISWETDGYVASEVEIISAKGERQTIRGIPSRRRSVLSPRGLLSGLSTHWLHTLAVPALARDTVHTYKILSSEPPVVHTLPSMPSESASFTFCSYGDCGGGAQAHRLVAQAIKQQNPALIVHLGDLVLAGNIDEEWRSFFDSASPYLSSIPIVPLPGNHDFRGSTTDFLQYFKSSFQDASAPAGMSESRHGRLWMLTLNCMSDFSSGTPARKYLESKLAAAAEDASIKYVLVLLHRPLYSWSDHKPRKYYPGSLKDELHTVFSEHQVTAVLSGHNHCYEHFERDKVTYLTLGGGGSSLYNPFSNRNPDEEAFHRISKEGYHFGSFTVGSEALQVRVIAVPSGEIFDEFPLGRREYAARSVAV